MPAVEALITHRIEACIASENRRSQGSGQQALVTTVTGFALQARHELERARTYQRAHLSNASERAYA